MADRDHPPGAPASESVVHLADLLDSAAVRLPEDHPGYPSELRLVFFEWFSSLRHAARLRRGGKDREAAIQVVSAASRFIARFERDTDADLTASFLSLESALMALDKGVVEPLLKRTVSRGRGWNSADREFVIGAAVIAVQHLRWAGLTAAQAHSAVAHTLHKAGFRAGRGSRPVEPRTVRHWCAQVAEDVGRHTQLARYVNDMLLDEDRTAIQARRPQIAQKHAIGVLESFVKLRCSAVLRKDS
jgi:hypothetical protein